MHQPATNPSLLFVSLTLSLAAGSDQTKRFPNMLQARISLPDLVIPAGIGNRSSILRHSREHYLREI